MGPMSATTINDLDRCPHGRHRGDACAGHRAGTSAFTRGCQGGYSIGNPWPMLDAPRIELAPDDRIGTTIGGHPILHRDLPTQDRPTWMRTRFRALLADPRPVMVPTPGPWWCSGEGEDYAIVVAYLRPDNEVTEWWPEASEITVQELPAIVFADRFPRPDWWSGDGLSDEQEGPR